MARSAYDLLFLSPTDHAHALQLEAKLWPALKPLFTAKEIPIEASALCLTPDDWTCCEPVGIPAISSSSCRAFLAGGHPLLERAGSAGGSCPSH